jgi:prolyl-tRNA synthetase
MRWSKLFIPTLRENPADAEDMGRQLLVRAGYIRQLSPGIHSYLFLGERSLGKIAEIVREEMDAIGAQEVRLPVLHPPRAWWPRSRKESCAATGSFHRSGITFRRGSMSRSIPGLTCCVPGSFS